MRISVVTTLLLLSLTGVAYAQKAIVGVVGFNPVLKTSHAKGGRVLSALTVTRTSPKGPS